MTMTATETASEYRTGNVQTGDYSLSGTDSTTFSEQYGSLNQSASTSFTENGDSSDDDISQTGNDLAGTYTLTETITADSTTSETDINAQGCQTTSITDTINSTNTHTDFEDSVRGSYTLTDDEDVTQTNDTTVSRRDVNSYTYSTDETENTSSNDTNSGNNITGSYTLTGNSNSQLTIDQDNSFDDQTSLTNIEGNPDNAEQGDSDTVTEIISSTSTLTGGGNSVTGDYSQTDVSTESATVLEQDDAAYNTDDFNEYYPVSDGHTPRAGLNDLHHRHRDR